MNINSIKNEDLMGLVENTTELKKLSKYRSKEYVASYIGLAIHRSYFYGSINLKGDVRPLSLVETIFNSTVDVILLVEGVVKLNSEPVNNGLGDIVYSGYGTLEVNGKPVYGGAGGGTGETLPITGDFTPSRAGGNIYIIDSPTPVYVTMNLDSCGLGEEIEFYQAGIGQIRLIDGTGTVVADVSVSKKSSSQYSTIAIKENVEGVFNVLGQTE